MYVLPRAVPRLLFTTRAVLASRFPPLSSEKNSSLFWSQHICLRERSKMAANSSDGTKEKIKEQVAKQKKQQQQSSKSIEVRLNAFRAA